jgi:hypothetical protein
MLEIAVDISTETIRTNTFADCPLLNSEYNTCQADPKGMACCIWDADSGFCGVHNLNPLCPLLKGDVVIRRK